jgi:hypothetical protein
MLSSEGLPLELLDLCKGEMRSMSEVIWGPVVCEHPQNRLHVLGW